jgi:hypothetical protein
LLCYFATFQASIKHARITAKVRQKTTESAVPADAENIQK